MKYPDALPHKEVPGVALRGRTGFLSATDHEPGVLAGITAPDTPRPPAAAPSMSCSRAFSWRGRTYAFGGAWFAFRHPDRSAVRESLQSANATHWARLPGDDATHVGAFRLPDERGRIYCAVEAARTFFGGDFVGAFELGSTSLPKAWWIVAVADDAVLLDRVFADRQDARNAYRSLFVPGRRFDTQVAPREIATNEVREVPLDEFLELADLPLRRKRALGTSLLQVSVAATLVLLGTALAASQLKGSAEPAIGASHETHQPIYPQFTEPAALGLACERAVAGALAAELDGWTLDSASCTNGEAKLAFSGGRSSVLRHMYRNAEVWEAERRAEAYVALTTPRQELLPHQLGAATAEDLANGLSVFGTTPRMVLVHMGTERAPFDSYQFEFHAAETMPVLIGAFASFQNAEWTEVRFASRQLQWRIVGMLHVDP